MFPKKLQKGDEIRVIAPARSLQLISQETQKIALNHLTQELGLKVTFGCHVNELDDFDSSSIQNRIDDLHEAFKDENVKGILTVIGGFNSNQLLPYLDYDCIQKNPKILCGFSDITALATAIYTKTNLVTYSGMHFSSFGMKKNATYQIEAFKRCLFSKKSTVLQSAEFWSDDEWYLSQEERQLNQNAGMKILTSGYGEGILIGGNLEVLNLLQGTEYMPSLKNCILFIEDLSTPELFDCNLESLLQQKDTATIKGLVIGRFQNQFNMTEDKLVKILRNKPLLNKIPVIYQADFGHTTPIFTFPIGGTVRIDTRGEQADIILLEH
ncbi:S66 family peptidase [Carnobacterium gallinarum]|uniref:S66 family peptidase n=1 Tax=Carnobacterium gallinarum TaxID=2749 RepID=UPI0005515DB1|nr:S66 peptidase family protein [Carnobacterium gallinarum]